MSKANEKRALRDRLTDEATTWLDDRAYEYRYDYERIVDEMVELLIAHRSAAERRALLSLARWASKTATAVERAPVKWHRADEHYAKVETLRVVASECRRRVRGKA